MSKLEKGNKIHGKKNRHGKGVKFRPGGDKQGQGDKKKNNFGGRNKVGKVKREENEVERLLQDYDQLDPSSSSSVKSFNQLPLSSLTKKGLKDCGFETPTEVQRESLIFSLKGQDVLGAAKTGSGKTLAFIIPLLEKLFVSKWSRVDGLGALVITPTRELAYQIFEQLRKVGKHHDFSAGLVIGGKDLHFESSRMASCNVVICTPGRLLQHMDENPNFDASSLKMLVLDEADRCLEMGFAEQMNAILDNLPREGRQTLLFSATQTRSVKDLARVGLDRPVFVSVHEHSSRATPDELTEHYMVCTLDQKVDVLWSFIKSHCKKKILVFLQSCKQVKYYSDLFRRLRAPTQIAALYGTLNQLRRMAIYREFCEAKSGVLMATDLAGRGLDFPTVDWVVQLDCPEDWKAYNHRVGRTARNKAKGQALLILMPSEQEAMLKHLRIHKFSLEKIEANPKKIVSIQRKVQAYLASDRELKEEAQRAFLSYLKSVFLMRDKAVFDVTQLDVDTFAASLGLAVTPRVRFLQKQLKSKKQVQKLDGEDTAEEKEVVDKRKMPIMKSILEDDDDDDDNDDDLLTVKRVNHDLSDEEKDREKEEDFEELKVPRAGAASKVITKASLAKKLMKKNILANQKVTFGEEGEVVDDTATQKKSQEGLEYEREEAGYSGIDLDKAKAVLKAEDKAFDRKKERERIREMHKEKRRKEKEAKNKRRKEQEGEGNEEEEDSEEDSDTPSLDWLPDPDKVYGKRETEDSENSDGGSDADETDSDASSEEETRREPKKKWKPPKKPKEAKKRRMETPEDEEYGEDDHAQLDDDESFALKLIQGR